MQYSEGAEAYLQGTVEPPWAGAQAPLAEDRYRQPTIHHKTPRYENAFFSIPYTCL